MEYLATNFPGLVSLWAMLAGLLVEVAEVAISVVPVLEAVLVVIVVVAVALPSPIVDPDLEGDLMWWQCRPPPCLLHFGVLGLSCRTLGSMPNLFLARMVATCHSGIIMVSLPSRRIRSSPMRTVFPKLEMPRIVGFLPDLRFLFFLVVGVLVKCISGEHLHQVSLLSLRLFFCFACFMDFGSNR
ncbi:hypothetical protein Taro_002831 [Colocasia esculenta]|uniref:Uncharacterized protein n=1 Tax=Colocasia esculenta TaxID=4460 RepID=A0A843THP5_COLES|nr:hypothetical protein [Colocasia esculenta]